LNVLERRVPPRAPLPPSGRLVEALHQQPWRLLPAIVTNALRAIPFIGLSGWKPWFERLLEWWPARVSMTLSAALLAALPVAPLISGEVAGHSRAGVMAASLLGLGLPIAGFMTRQIASEIDREGLAVEVRRHARRVATRWRSPGSPRRYVVFGHTHRPETCERARADPPRAGRLGVPRVEHVARCGALAGGRPGLRQGVLPRRRGRGGVQLRRPRTGRRLADRHPPPVWVLRRDAHRRLDPPAGGAA